MAPRHCAAIGKSGQWNFPVLMLCCPFTFQCFWWIDLLPRMPLDGSRASCLRLEIISLLAFSYLISCSPPRSFLLQISHAACEPSPSFLSHKLFHRSSSFKRFSHLNDFSELCQRRPLLSAMNTQSFWAPAAGWCRVDTGMACEASKPVEMVASPYQAMTKLTWRSSLIHFSHLITVTTTTTTTTEHG